MKKNIKNNLKKLIIASLYLNSQLVYAESTFIQEGQNQIMNTDLAYEKCPMIDEMVYDINLRTQVKSGRQIEEPGCVARNRQKSEARNVANQGLQRANSMNSGNSDGLNKPVPPPDPHCGTETDSTTGRFNFAYHSCMSNYNNQMREYQLQMTSYNTAVNEQAKSAQSNDLKNQQEYAAMKDQTATGSMNEIQQKNNKGKQLYTAAAAIAAGIAVGYYARSAVCAAQCAGFGSGCCVWAPALMASGVAFMLINGMSNKQSSQHAQSALSACTAYNQISTDKKDCSTEGQAAPITISAIDPTTGKCKTDAPPECQQGLDQAGIKVPISKNADGKVNKMAGLEIEKMATMLPDGRVKDKNGKVWSMADFADKKSMMAAGLSAADANKIFGELYGPNGAMAKTGINAKDALKDESKKNAFSGIGLGTGGGINIVDVNKNSADPNKLYKEKLNEVNPDEGRKPSSEGLAKEFNGELIGVSGDDIFVMMNRRYKFKSEQDSFISADAHK